MLLRRTEFLYCAGAWEELCSPYEVANHSPELDIDILHPWVHKFYPVLGLGTFNCNGSPYGFNCHGPRGSPKKWPTYVKGLFVTCDVLTRYFFTAFPWVFRGPYLLGKTVFGHFLQFLRGPHFGQVLHVLVLDKSSEYRQDPGSRKQSA